jgi:hypothetical protein
MGLDLLELTLRIEETFAIQIPDDVAYKLTTPGQVTDYILTQVGESQFTLPQSRGGDSRARYELHVA